MNQPNRLARSTSPYLRQHAHNPVDWHPWGDEAFGLARAEDKPIFLSIGYSACHWCHVMAHESFEHPAVAELLNQHFISIKLDREEFPDLDHLYMTATSLMTGRGGWPNSLWLLPDGRPWYAGTYFPRDDHPGRMGFITLLKRLHGLWITQRGKVEEQATTLTDAIRAEGSIRHHEVSSTWLAIDWARHAQQHFHDRFDARYGGFGDAPKFPPHSGMLMLMESVAIASNPEIDHMIQFTLDAMARGGIHDQIGGGFHRYATDEQWHLPHFEKMLYDNALLLNVYARAAVLYHRADFRRVGLGIADWLMREMQHPGGAFYAALDADSEGEEGIYYTWTADELKNLLPPDHYASFAALYQIQPDGNYHDEASRRPTGRNIPHLRRDGSLDEIAAMHDVLKQLLEVRRRRVPPGLDDKIIVGWNGLAISALAIAGRLLNEPRLIDAAGKARNFIAANAMTGDRLARCWSGLPSPQEGRLEDYAALALADLDLFDATKDAACLERATQLMERITGNFFDASTGEMFMTTGDDITAGLRMKDAYDQGSPSGTGLAVQAAIRIGRLTGNQTYSAMARRAARTFGYHLYRAPSMTGCLLQGVLLDIEQNAPGELPAVHFSIEPASLKINAAREAEATLRCTLPQGWTLNELTDEAEQRAGKISIAWQEPGPPVAVRLLPSGETTWTLHFKCSHEQALVPGNCTLAIRYQPCTPTECREAAVQSLEIRLD